MTKSYSFPLTAAGSLSFLDISGVSSTNSVLRAQPEEEPYAVALSLSQRSGKGRNGRAWVSRPGEALALSVLLRHDIITAEITTWVPLLAGVAAVRAAQEIGVTDAALKWPNDVLVDSAKLAGILCEMLPSGSVVVGVGINLDFESAPPVPGATSVAEHATVGQLAPDHFAHNFLNHLKNLVSCSVPAASEQVSSVMETLGRDVSVLEMGGSRWSGRAERLTPSGALLVADLAGIEHILTAADVKHLYQ